MKHFSALFTDLDSTTSTAAKVQAVTQYLALAPAQDAAWAVYFLSGGKLRQVVQTATLRRAALSVADLPEWLFEACYQAVGDLAETIAQVLPAARHSSELGLAQWVEDRLLALRGLPEPEVVHRVKTYWDELDPQSRFLLNKLVGGGFRVVVSRLLVQRALAAHAGIDATVVAQRMTGYTDARFLPTAQAFAALVAADGPDQAPRERSGQPYPFFLAHPLGLPEPLADELISAEPSHWLAQMNERLGSPALWQVEWMYDGIRGQLVKRAGQVWLWSGAEELLTDRFPEITALGSTLPDGTVLDGEIMAWVADRPAPFALLEQRIARKTLSKKVLADAPVIFMAYDLLEWQGHDVRAAPQSERRALLEFGLAGSGFAISPTQQLNNWRDYALLRQTSRARSVEGLMLKHRDAAYGTGRSKAEGMRWTWKIEPMSVDCVLIYAQVGHGRGASLYTDYTFAVWNRPPASAAEVQAVIENMGHREPAPTLVTSALGEPPLQLLAFAKAYSGLSDAEFKAVDAVVRKNTLEKFGPVRGVRPTLVFELGFEGIHLSPRHKCGIAVRCARMLRLRPDKPLHEAGSMADLRLLLQNA